VPAQPGPLAVADVQRKPDSSCAFGSRRPPASSLLPEGQAGLLLEGSGPRLPCARRLHQPIPNRRRPAPPAPVPAEAIEGQATTRAA